jgi:hemolysin III
MMGCHGFVGKTRMDLDQGHRGAVSQARTVRKRESMTERVDARISHGSGDEDAQIERAPSSQSGLLAARSRVLSHAVHEAPVQPDQEWANALTHGIAAVGTILLGTQLVIAALPTYWGLVVACAAYAASVLGTFVFSTLSHLVRRQPLLNTMRAYDQAMIYLMISGTYTPIIVQYASDSNRSPLLWAIWIAAWLGFLKKVALRYRINSIGTYTYLLLGWLPAVPIASRVPTGLVGWMLAGGVLYTVGVIFLMNDRKVPYLHAAWHISVMLAAASHYYGILRYVVQ